MLREQIPQEIRTQLGKDFNCPIDDLYFGPQFGKGRSGDEVYLMTVSRSAALELNGEYVLKIQKKSTGSEFEREISNTNNIKAKCQSGKIKIPTLRCFSPALGYYVYDVAGTGAKETSELSMQSPEKKLSRFRDLIDVSLFAWQGCTSMGSSTASEMVKNWLGEKRLAPDSTLAQRVHRYIEDELQPAWRLDDIVLPNPYHFFTCVPEEEEVLPNLLQGPQHGDMNQSNVLIQPCGQGYTYYLIDFSHYQDQTFLLFDQAYLLLDTLLEINGILLTDWINHLDEFFSAVINPNDPLCSSSECDKYCVAFIDGWTRYYNRFPNNGRVMAIQLLCACAAAGLNFMNKSAASEKKQIFSFAFASIAAKKIAELGVGELPAPDGDYPPISIGRQGQGVPELWKLTHGFAPDSKYILISPCLPEDYHPDTFGALGAIPWAAVIEINDLVENPLRDASLRRFRKKQSYHHILLSKDSEIDEFGKIAVWCSIPIDKEERNKAVFYLRSIHPNFSICLNRLLAQYEKYPLCILIDSEHLDETMYGLVLADIVAAAGEKAAVDVIDLSNREAPINSGGNIRAHQLLCPLPQLALNIQISFRQDDDGEVQIPTAESFVTLERSLVTEIETDMQIIHRNLANSANDDQGEGFYSGGEVTWLDLVYHRDATRVDYHNTWLGRIRNKIDRLHSSASSIIWLYHRPGGGGSTMARRIMWDFCSQYPTVYLKQISDQTAERIKTLYRTSLNRQLLIVAEISDSVISNMALTALRMDLIKKSVRACFICVARRNEGPDDNMSSNFFLPSTPSMTIAAQSDEAKDMYRTYAARLDADQDLERLNDLSSLAHTDQYSDEMRQPFFFGLFTYGENYKRIDDYVKINLREMGHQEALTLMMLAFNTAYSQGVNLNVTEVAGILYPDQVASWEVLDKTRDFLHSNCFIVPRDDGYRVSHPLIANALLKHYFSGTAYHRSLIDLAKKQVDYLGKLYDFDADRLDNIFHELFIHREPITEDQRNYFSNFITDLDNDAQRIDMMDYLRVKFPRNPHYSNHLARLYLKPQDDRGWADIPKAKKYAAEAIKRAERLSQDSGLIHHHLMGKVYTKECIIALRKRLGKDTVSKALQNISSLYDSAFREFNICSGGGNSDYGLVGKLELVNKVLATLQQRRSIPNIPELMRQNHSVRRQLIKMITEGGDAVRQYTVTLDDSDSAFRNAALSFYKVMGKVSAIKSLLEQGKKDTNPAFRAHSRRSLVTIYEAEGRNRENVFSYDSLSTDTLKKIKDLMGENIFHDFTGSTSDRFRWLEAARRLDSFSLPEAYEFFQTWPKADESLDAAYFRYVIAFLFYAKYQGVSFQSVREHLIHCQTLAEQAYGKYTSISRDFCGKLGDEDIDRSSLISWQRSGRDSKQEIRDRQNKEYRESRCDYIIGSVGSIRDGMMDFRFSMEQTGSTLFMAKAPIVDVETTLMEGEQVKFHLAFSYTGFRAWDIVPLGGN